MKKGREEQYRKFLDKLISDLKALAQETEDMDTIDEINMVCECLEDCTGWHPATVLVETAFNILNPTEKEKRDEIPRSKIRAV